MSANEVNNIIPSWDRCGLPMPEYADPFENYNTVKIIDGREVYVSWNLSDKFRNQECESHEELENYILDNLEGSVNGMSTILN